MPDLSDEKTLLERARQLDERALSEIHTRYYGEIYRYALYRTSRSEVAEDVASEVFMRLLDAVHGGRAPQTTVRGWLFGVTNNLVADYFRAAPRESAELDESLAASGTPTGEAERNWQITQVQTAMRQLTHEQQHALTLRFAEGFSVEETAGVMGKTPNAVRVLQFRAVEALKRVLKVGEVAL